VREAGSIDLVRRVHAFLLEGSGRILNQDDVVAKFHAKARGGFDAGVRDHADQDDVLDPPLCELGVEIGVGEAALPPVLKHDGVAVAGGRILKSKSGRVFFRRLKEAFLKFRRFER
jgi:hypothetical protein